MLVHELWCYLDSLVSDGTASNCGIKIACVPNHITICNVHPNL